ncbi:MAG: PEP-CTERM sorting domain-containing protein, partial [Bryobacteraceae bacterium]
GIEVGDYGATGWHAFNYILPADGTYRLGFGVVNTYDGIVPGYLMLDNGPGTLSGLGGQIPEPATFALLGAGLLALGVLRRR